MYPQFEQLQTRLAVILAELDRKDARAERAPARPRATGIFARLGFRRR